MSVIVEGPSASGLSPLDGLSKQTCAGSPACGTPMSEISTAPNTPIHQFQLPEQCSISQISASRLSIDAILESESDDDYQQGMLEELAEDADSDEEQEAGGKVFPTLEKLEKSLQEVKDLFKLKYGYDVDADSVEEQEHGHSDDAFWCIETSEQAASNLEELEKIFDEVNVLVEDKYGLDVDVESDDEQDCECDEESVLWIETAGPDASSLGESSAKSTPPTHQATLPLNADDEDGSLWMCALQGLLQIEEPAECIQDSMYDDSALWMQALDGSLEIDLEQSEIIVDANECGITEVDIPLPERQLKETSEEEQPYQDPQEQELATLDIRPTPRYRVDDLAWQEHLDSQGFVVIADVAGALELSLAENLLWQFLEGCTDWQRHEPGTWNDEGLANIGTCKFGIIEAGGIGQSDFMWFLRTLPQVRHIFSQIWGTDDLISSFDGACLFRPWHHGFRKTACGWWHVDQGAAQQGRHAVQGLISLYEASGHTGGLTVVPGSHLLFQEFIQDQKDPSRDFYSIPHNSAALKEHSKQLVCCLPGDVVLWDSRTIHASAPAPLQPETPVHQLLRAVGYVCMTPKSFASADVLAMRRFAYEHCVTTSHWPHKYDVKREQLEDDEAQRSLSEASEEIVALVG